MNLRVALGRLIQFSVAVRSDLTIAIPARCGSGMMPLSRRSSVASRPCRRSRAAAHVQHTELARKIFGHDRSSRGETRLSIDGSSACPPIRRPGLPAAADHVPNCHNCCRQPNCHRSLRHAVPGNGPCPARCRLQQLRGRPERDAIVAGWAARSARVRRECAGHLDLAYGDTPRERLDLFLAADPKGPTLGVYPWRILADERRGEFRLLRRGPASARDQSRGHRIHLGAGRPARPYRRRGAPLRAMARRTSW